MKLMSFCDYSVDNTKGKGYEWQGEEVVVRGSAKVK